MSPPLYGGGGGGGGGYNCDAPLPPRTHAPEDRRGHHAGGQRRFASADRVGDRAGDRAASGRDAAAVAGLGAGMGAEAQMAVARLVAGQVGSMLQRDMEGLVGRVEASLSARLFLVENRVKALELHQGHHAAAGRVHDRLDHERRKNSSASTNSSSARAAAATNVPPGAAPHHRADRPRAP
jgi:hypothetical protein